MTSQIIYTSPVCESLDEDEEFQGDSNPASMDALNYLFNQDQSYWQNPIGSGHGMFEIVRNNLVVARLTISKLNKVGYWICITLIVDSVPSSFLAVNERQDSSEWIDLMTAGEEEPWPAVFFHSINRTSEIVRQFCAVSAGTGTAIELPPCINWTTWGEAAVDNEEKSFNSEVVKESRNYA